MRIILATDSFIPNVGGISYFTQRIASRLRDRGHEILVLCPSPNLQCEWLDHGDMQVFGVASFPSYVHRGRPDRYRIAPAFLVRGTIENVIADFAPDVAHIQTHFFIGQTTLDICRRSGIPVVGTNHFMPENLFHFFHLPESYQETAWKFYAPTLKAHFELCDAVTTPTRTAAEFLSTTGLTKEIQPISCGIDLTMFRPGSSKKGRQFFGLKQRKTLLSVGRLEKEKRVDIVIRSMAEIVRTIDAQLLIVGTGVEQEALQALTRELSLEDRVIFAGFVPDDQLPLAYHAADCFVTASIAELQSIVTMEAMASGLPVLAVNAMALPELVHNGENGYLFAKDDSIDLARKAVKLLSNDTRNIAMVAESQRIIRRHDIDDTIDAYEKLYASLARMRQKQGRQQDARVLLRR